MLDPDKVLTGIWKILSGDTLLQGADYLDGPDKIWKGSLRPKQENHPVVTIEGTRSYNPYTNVELWALTVNIYSNTLDNGTEDLARLGKISLRISELVVGSSFDVEGGKVFSINATEDRGKFDAATKESSLRSMRFEMHAKEM